MSAGDDSINPLALAYENVRDTFYEDYPLLEDLFIATADCGQLTPSPLFLGYLLEAARQEDCSPCCFVLPCSTQIAQITSSLFVLDSIRRELPNLRLKFATEGLHVGQRVKVLPSEDVYEYCGLYPHDPRYFKLAKLGTEGKESRSIPIGEILRLEPTERKRPKGCLEKSPFGKSIGNGSPVGLSALLGEEFYGNQSIFDNLSVLMSSQAQMRTFVEEFWAKSSSYPCRVKIWDYIPWGTISDTGDLQHEDSYVARGRPCVAVSSNPLHVTEFCRKTKAERRLVVADKLDYFKHNLQAFDELAEKQHLMVVTDASDSSLLNELASRGLKVWRLTPREMFFTEDGTLPVADDNGCFEIYRQAEIAYKLEINELHRESPVLDAVAGCLNASKNCLESDPAIDEFLGKLWGVLCSAAAVACKPDPEWVIKKISLVQRCSSDLHGMSQWIPKDIVGPLESSCSMLENFLEQCICKPTDKCDQLVSYAANHRDGFLTVVVPHQDLVAATRSQFPAQPAIQVKTIADLAVDCDHEFGTEVLVTCWPNRIRWNKLVSLNLSPKITLLSHSFESTFLSSYLRERRRRIVEQTPSSEIRAAICGVPSTVLQQIRPDIAVDALESSRPNDRPAPSESWFSTRKDYDYPAAIEPGPQAVEATYVGFTGDTFAYLTDRFQATVVTNLLSASSPGEIEWKCLTDLNVCDYLLFIEGAETDLLSDLCKQRFPDYPSTFECARLWHAKLVDFQGQNHLSTAQIITRLQAIGLERHDATIRAWIENPHLIAPSTEDDIAKIAELTGDSSFKSAVPRIHQCAKRVRTWHQQVGRSLGEAIIRYLQDNEVRLTGAETKIEVECSSAWIVEIEYISASRQWFSSSSVNKLKWN